MSESAGRRTHRIQPTEPDGEPVCSLTAAGAGRRRAPIDRLLESGTFEPRGEGYRIELPRDDDAWELAVAFIEEEEEAACCLSFEFDATEQDDVVVVRAAYQSLD